MMSAMSPLIVPLSSSALRWLSRNLLVLALAGVAGCKDRSIVAYRVPKDVMPGPGATESSPAAAPAASGIRWDAPAGWQPQKADGLRAASFLVTGVDGTTADMSIVTFAGTGGDDLANVNRWRGQLQLPAITAADFPAQVQSLVLPAGAVSLVDLNGTTGEAKSPARLLGAWLRSPERVWFFKLMGPGPLVTAQRDSFMLFLNSVALGAGAPMEAATPAPTVAAIPTPSDAGPSLRWHAPADWQMKAASAMRKGSYTVSGAEVAITVFPGDVGGVLANINRWRGQVGLEPVEPAGLDSVTTQLSSNGLHFIATDAAGTAPGAPRIVAVLVPWQGHTWFFKLTGPADAVGRAKPAFLEFIQTVETP